MYTKQDISRQRQAFWTSFGQYMKPLPGAAGEAVNWLNYKTGVRHLFFRMDADTQQASIFIEIADADQERRSIFLQRFLALRELLEEHTGETWDWEEHTHDDFGKPISRIAKTLNGVNIMQTTHWPQIISFLKPRIMALDAFWEQTKDIFID